MEFPLTGLIQKTVQPASNEWSTDMAEMFFNFAPTVDIVRLVHYSAASAGKSGSVVASDVDTADTLWRQSVGLMFRTSLAPGYGLAFRFDDISVRNVHMMFVFTELDVVWVAEDVVQRVERLRPFRDFARERADLIVELPPGAASEISVGDRLVLEEPS